MTTNTTPGAGTDEITALRDMVAVLKSRELRYKNRIQAAAMLCYTAKAGGRVGIVKADDLLRALDAH